MFKKWQKEEVPTRGKRWSEMQENIHGDFKEVGMVKGQELK